MQPVIENHSSVHCDNERLSKKHIKATNKSLSKSIKNIYQSSTKINYNNFLNYINVLLLWCQLLSYYPNKERDILWITLNILISQSCRFVKCFILGAVKCGLLWFLFLF